MQRLYGHDADQHHQSVTSQDWSNPLSRDYFLSVRIYPEGPVNWREFQSLSRDYFLSVS